MVLQNLIHSSFRVYVLWKTKDYPLLRQSLIHRQRGRIEFAAVYSIQGFGN